MNKILIFLLATMLLLNSAKSQNLMDAICANNAGFENRLSGWRDWGNTIGTEDSYSGAAAMQVAAAGGFGSSISYAVREKQSFLLSAFVKVSGMPSYTGFGVHFLDADGNQLGQAYYSVSGNKGTYTRYELPFIIPANTASIRVWGWNDGGGTALFDDFYLVENKLPTRYYVDNNGNDDNNGSKEAPWKTLTRVAATLLLPGDTVFFAAGQVFHGTLYLNRRHSGNEAAWVVVSSSGEGRATIDGGDDAAIILEDASFLSVGHLTVRGSGRNSGNAANGIFINRCNHIAVNNSDIAGFQHAGININQSDDISVIYTDAHENGYSGISSMGVYYGKRNRNIYLSHCNVSNNAGDPSVTDNHSGSGIVVGETDNAIIEYCYSYNNGWDMPRKGNGPVGIWCWHADNCIIQHCIARENKTSAGSSDGGGFDLDGGVTNSILQYNISYGNQGAGIGLYQFSGAMPWHNNTVRYNVSENDGDLHGGGIHFWNGSVDADMKDIFVYNNVIYNQAASPVVFSDYHHSNVHFSNNIFAYRTEGVTGQVTAGRDYFTGNLWNRTGGGFSVNGFTDFNDWANATGNEKLYSVIVGRSDDPLFTAAGTTSITDPSSLSAYSAYHLLPGSPAIDAGIDIFTLLGIANAGIDLEGTKVPYNGLYDMGAFEYTGSPAAGKKLLLLPELLRTSKENLQIIGNPVNRSAIRIRFTEVVKKTENNQWATVQVLNLAGSYCFNQSVQLNLLQDGFVIKPVNQHLLGGIYIVLVKYAGRVYTARAVVAQ